MPKYYIYRGDGYIAMFTRNGNNIRYITPIKGNCSHINYNQDYRYDSNSARLFPITLLNKVKHG